MGTFQVCNGVINVDNNRFDFSCGERPYTHLSNQDTISALQNGYRLEKPKDCPDAIYQIICSCWNADPEKRPSFGELLDQLSVG